MALHPEGRHLRRPAAHGRPNSYTTDRGAGYGSFGRTGLPALLESLFRRDGTGHSTAVRSWMRIEDALPALRAGRRARRRDWPPGDHILVELIAGKRCDHFTMKAGAGEHTWPSSQRESGDMLLDDWELLALPEYEAYVPRNFKEAMDIVLSMMSAETFDAYDSIRDSRSPSGSGIRGLSSDHDWRTMGKACLGAYMEAASSKDREVEKAALARACIFSLKALSFNIAERYAEEVMNW